MLWKDYKEQFKEQHPESKKEIELDEAVCSISAKIIMESEKFGISPRKLWRMTKV